MRADKIKNEPVKWLWKERIPIGMLSVIAGKPGGAKTLLAVRIATDVSKHFNVILSATEDPLKQMLGPRLTAARANKKRVIVDFNPILPDDLDELASQIKRSRAKLVLLDPLNDHIDLTRIKRHADSIRRVTKPLKRMAEDLQVAIVIVDHTIKSVPASGHPLAAIGGSGSGVAAAARMAYIVGRDPSDKDRVLMCNVKSNLRDEPRALEFEIDIEEVIGVPDQPILVEVGECDFDPMELLKKPGKRGGKLGRPPTKREAAMEWLIEYLHVAPNYEFKSTEIIEDAKQAGITTKTLRNAQAEAGVIAFKKGSDWWWRLPKDLIDILEDESADS